jgi:hypothetical protein
MLLVAGRTREAAFEHLIGGECDALRTRRYRRRRARDNFYKPLGTPLQNISGNSVCIESCIPHFVAGETGFAVGKGITGKKAVNPAQLTAAAPAMAGAAILDAAVSTRQRSRHQKLRTLGENNCDAHADKSYKRHHFRNTVAQGGGSRLPIDLGRLKRSVPHHQAPDEKA